eukprot:9504098-Pyramimonas_sp.AAC.4
MCVQIPIRHRIFEDGWSKTAFWFAALVWRAGRPSMPSRRVMDLVGRLGLFGLSGGLSGAS